MNFKTFYEAQSHSVAAVMGKIATEVNTFDCHNRGITSLVGCPRVVNGTFDCGDNKLVNLKGGPVHVDGDYDCSYNPLLTSLEGVAPTIGTIFTCMGNKQITSLHNIHKHIKSIYSGANFNMTPIKSHVLGLLLINDLASVWLDNKQVEKIINKHLKGDRDFIDCQEELMNAGFDDYAQL